MASTLWQPGRRLFSTASVLIIITAVLHTIGFFFRSANDAEMQLMAGLRGFVLPAGLGMKPTMLSLFQNLGAAMTITFVAIGALNLLLAGSADLPHRLFRRLAWANVIWVGAFAVASIIWPFQPPFICAALIEVLMVASLIGGSAQPAGPVLTR